MPLTFVGDCKPGGPGRPGLPGTTGGVIANAEFSVAGAESASSSKAYALTLEPDLAATLPSLGLSAANVANNHVHDAGPGAFRRTVDALRAAGVEAYGSAERPFVVLEEAGLRCAVIGSLEPCRARTRDLFREEDVEALVRELARSHHRVFVTPHWGKEGEYDLFPSPRQRRLARRWIDAGAHAVLGHHSHTAQAAERIDGRPIYYGLGNYWFDHEEGRAHPLTRVGWAARWIPGNGAESDTWEVRPFHRTAEGLRPLPGEAARAWEEAHARLTGALSAEGRWNAWRWARAVGPVYLPKSRASWSRRLRRHPLRSAPLWAAWSVLPTTLLLRAGEALADPHCAALRAGLTRVARGLPD